MDIKTERALAALEHAYQLIREAHQIADDGHGSIEAREVRLAARKLAKARGYDPDALVAFVPQEKAIGLVQPDGAIAVALLPDQATIVPTWKLFEADARTAITAVRPPAPSKRDAQARAIGDAFGMWHQSPDMRRQHADD